MILILPYERHLCLGAFFSFGIYKIFLFRRLDFATGCAILLQDEENSEEKVRKITMMENIRATYSDKQIPCVIIHHVAESMAPFLIVFENGKLEYTFSHELTITDPRIISELEISRLKSELSEVEATLGAVKNEQYYEVLLARQEELKTKLNACYQKRI